MTDMTLETPDGTKVHFTEETLKAATEKLGGSPMRLAREQLRSIVERIERLEEEKKSLSDDVRDIYAEAKGNGYDVAALRAIIRIRKQDAAKRAEQETILETYMQALGMISSKRWLSKPLSVVMPARLSRASTSYVRRCQDVDGRDKPGHDERGG